MRLKKNPDLPDYYVETIVGNELNDSVHTVYNEFFSRANARAFAKSVSADYRVRIFHARFTLVSDSKRKVRKSASAGKGAK